jgi:uncharacterized protein YchJ
MLSELELKELKDVMSTISTHIPEHQAGYIWTMYNKLGGDHGNQPCMCGSASKYWKAAVDFLNDYLKKN